MVKVLGVDPGTKSFDFCGLTDGKPDYSKSIPSVEIAENPQSFVEAIESFPADYIVGPSGYGVPVKRLDELDQDDFFHLTLVRPEELDKVAVLSGMQKSFKALLEKKTPMYFIPGIIHMPTIPRYRKLNKIDMGTADKLCCAVLGIYDQSKRQCKEYKDTSFILLEVGFGYTSAVAVEKGKIIDGVGGTMGAPGYTSLGAMDAELAYLLGKFPKTLIFDGGASSLLPPGTTLEEFAKKKEGYKEAWDCLVESAVRDVLMLLSSLKKPEEILLSGRLMRIPGLVKDVSERLAHYASVRKLQGLNSPVKEAAQGAAIVADGLAGGEYAQLIDNLEIRKAQGSVLDYINLKEAPGLLNK